MISEATEKDWEDFWKSEDFDRVWWEMESIEPLTPVTKIERES
tara:strand:- start:152 stop:280 length:129 start_codon:yes stop_codon:yes gene_type:complete